MNFSQHVGLLLSGTMAFGSAVSLECRSPYRFTGKINTVTVELK
jgi:hypothetical protein